MGINPVPVEPVQFIIIVHTLALTIIECRKRDAEAILVVLQINIRIIRQMAVDACTLSGTDQHIMYFYIFKK